VLSTGGVFVGAALWAPPEVAVVATASPGGSWLEQAISPRNTELSTRGRQPRRETDASGDESREITAEGCAICGTIARAQAVLQFGTACASVSLKSFGRDEFAKTPLAAVPNRPIRSQGTIFYHSSWLTQRYEPSSGLIALVWERRSVGSRD
jgi:hypothetical protein